MKKKDLYFTDDLPLAAYLCHRGYTLLGAVDTGSERKQFALTHLKLRHDPEALQADILRTLEDYNRPYKIEGIDGKFSYKDYYVKIRMCKRAAFEPVTLKQVESV